MGVRVGTIHDGLNELSKKHDGLEERFNNFREDRAETQSSIAALNKHIEDQREAKSNAMTLRQYRLEREHDKREQFLTRLMIGVMIATVLLSRPIDHLWERVFSSAAEQAEAYVENREENDVKDQRRTLDGE